MLDTGAQLNAIHPDAVVPATGPTVALQGVGGDSTASEFVVLAVRFPGSAACIVPFLVVPHLPRAAMLGQAFLTASKAVVDLGAGTVRLSGISQPLVGSRPTKPLKRSEAVLSVIITPSSELTEDITPCTSSTEADTRPAEDTIESADPGEATLQDARPPPGLTLDAVTNALNELSTPALSVEERASVLALLRQHKALWLGDPRGTLVAYHHRVVVTTDYPVRCGPRRFTPEEREVQKKELAAMLDAGVVRVSHSPHVSEVVMIKKANGTWRFCIDFRPLNAVTRLDSQPLPRISDLVRAVGGSKYFAALDLRSGYWQIAMSPESIPYTAFRCCGGLYEFTVMPFGLVNAPATFQRAMMTVLSDLVDQGVQVYLDDILVHASTFCECHVLLADVLNRLERAGLTVNLQKCVFYPHEVLYLGHLLGGGTRRPNPKRVDILSRWKIPTNVSELRSLLGALTYYHEYVPRFAELARRPSDLLRGLSKQEAKAKSKHPIVWPEECTADINAVVSALRTAILVRQSCY